MHHGGDHDDQNLPNPQEAEEKTLPTPPEADEKQLPTPPEADEQLLKGGEEEMLPEGSTESESQFNPPAH